MDNIYEEIDENVVKEIEKAEQEIKEELNKVDKICFQNSLKVLNAFHKYHDSESNLIERTVYGYKDI